MYFHQDWARPMEFPNEPYASDFSIALPGRDYNLQNGSEDTQMGSGFSRPGEKTPMFVSCRFSRFHPKNRRIFALFTTWLILDPQRRPLSEGYVEEAASRVLTPNES